MWLNTAFIYAVFCAKYGYHKQGHKPRQGSTLVLALLPWASRICKLYLKGKWNLYLTCPSGQVCCIYFRFTFEKVSKFCCLASKLVVIKFLSHASTMFYLVLNETLQNIHFFKGRWKLEWVPLPKKVNARSKIHGLPGSRSHSNSQVLHAIPWIYPGW